MGMNRDGDGRDGCGTWRVEGVSGTRDEEVERKCCGLWWWQERKGRWAGGLDLRIGVQLHARENQLMRKLVEETETETETLSMEYRYSIWKLSRNDIDQKKCPSLFASLSVQSVSATFIVDHQTNSDVTFENSPFSSFVFQKMGFVSYIKPSAAYSPLPNPPLPPTPRHGSENSH